MSEQTFEFTGLYNLRDLGGLRAGDGRPIRPGVLFRSDSPHEASEADVDHLVNTLGVTSIVDLRAERELVADGTNPLIPPAVRHQHFPIDGGPGGAIEGAPEGSRLALRYLEYLDRHADAIVGAVRAVAHSDGGTIVHCRAGKDRTGVVIAVILDALGVDPVEIAHDYELTTEPMNRIMARLRASRTYAANVAKLPAEMYSSRAATMTDFLAELHTRHGGAGEWLLANDLSRADLVALAEHLLADSESPGNSGSFTAQGADR
ncbi:Protein tyrosine/serine phosphatase [Micromonospora pallida]|uniref:Protein tyrosine/serine phosphatase n=1 Tax=Micromonospora pallida TaxID=145854 RepID=A0A1C6RS85_9ACTN|nr:tyrosine-protein phosphatase [Micromonospora pallida]SCL20074.1 Protein tyrosine/serine phosphatase [Micromonospora pallida]